MLCLIVVLIVIIECFNDCEGLEYKVFVECVGYFVDCFEVICLLCLEVGDCLLVFDYLFVEEVCEWIVFMYDVLVVLLLDVYVLKCEVV